jgi:hypothetical protein
MEGFFRFQQVNKFALLSFRYNLWLHSQVEKDGAISFLPIDFQQLKNLCCDTNLLNALKENPKEALLCMGVAVHLVDDSFHAKFTSVTPITHVFLFH